MPWLIERARYPFDVDGKVTARSEAELTAALEEHLPDIADQVRRDETCDSITREELLAGAPWHWLDRLGSRPPADALERDLDRLGVEPDHALVNCYHGDHAGFVLLVVAPDSDARIAMFRN